MSLCSANGCNSLKAVFLFLFFLRHETTAEWQHGETITGWDPVQTPSSRLYLDQGEGFSGGSEGVDTGTMLNCLSRVFFPRLFFRSRFPFHCVRKPSALSHFHNSDLLSTTRNKNHLRLDPPAPPRPTGQGCVCMCALFLIAASPLP